MRGKTKMTNLVIYEKTAPLRGFAFMALVALGSVGTYCELRAETGKAHSHSETKSDPVLKLNDGKKWETDTALREGMSQVKIQMESNLHAIHNNKLASGKYLEISKSISEQLGKIFKGCKLKPDADAMLHVILAQMISGANQMKSEKTIKLKREGAIKIISALGQYGEFFDHPSWVPIQHE